jgi:hypothetical protein
MQVTNENSVHVDYGRSGQWIYLTLIINELRRVSTESFSAPLIMKHHKKLSVITTGRMQLDYLLTNAKSQLCNYLVRRGINNFYLCFLILQSSCFSEAVPATLEYSGEIGI